MALTSATAFAEPSPDQAKAEALFTSAKERMAIEDYVTACAELSESDNLDPQVGTTLNLAYCYEQLGRTATARALWRRAATAAAAKGELERVEFARERARMLEPQLLYATIVVTPEAAAQGVRVVVDQTALLRMEWGSPVAFDPGEHELVATAAGSRPWRQKFTVARGMEPAILVPKLEPSAGPIESRPTRDQGSAWPTVMWATGGAGVAAVGVGGAFGVAALVNESASNANHNCAKAGCDGPGQADRNRVRTDEPIANVLFLTGGAAVLASASVLIVLYRSGATSSGARWTAGVHSNASGAEGFVGGCW